MLGVFTTCQDRARAIYRSLTGEADAVVVHVTDVKAGGAKVQGVLIPDAHNVVSTYPIAVVKATKNQSAAQAYVDAVVSGSGQKALQAQGFLPPT